MNKLLALCKYVSAWLIVNLFKRDLLKKEIWLIREKGIEARDNGYHLFKYMRTVHPECNVYYAIDMQSKDLCKIQKYGNIIQLNSLLHYQYYIAAKYSISSQPRGAVPYPDIFLYRFRIFNNARQRIIFLQHGVIKDNLTDVLDYSMTKFHLFSCSAKRERDYVQESCHYPDGVVQNLGLCRFDNLLNQKNQAKKQILIMPTFRSWLKSSNSSKEATDSEKVAFIESEFYISYSRLLTNSEFLSSIKDMGFSIVFYPHYAMQPYVHCFDKFQSDIVTIADREHYDVQQLLIESSIMITDFSSVFFDFAYMEKPEVFFQFDEEKYRSSHYKEGYFDYRRDGFGPVFTDYKEVSEYIVELIKNNCQVENKYLDRIQNFFDLRDDKNCERTYQAIINLDEVH